MRFSQLLTAIAFIFSSVSAATIADPRLAAALAAARPDVLDAFTAFIADAPLGSPEFANKMALRKAEWDIARQSKTPETLQNDPWPPYCSTPSSFCSISEPLKCCTGICIADDAHWAGGYCF